MTREQLLYEMENATQRGTGETLGAAAGGALRGGLAGAGLPLLYNLLAPRAGLPKIPVKNLVVSGLSGAGVGGALGAITGGGFGQGFDSANASLLSLPFEYGQADQARKAKKLDELYGKLRNSNYQENL